MVSGYPYIMKFAFRSHLILIVSALSTNALSISDAKAKVLSLARSYMESNGVFVSDDSKRKELQKAVAELEAICGPPKSIDKETMLGEWTLLSTTNVSPLPPFPLKILPRNPVQDELRKVVYSNVEVIQKIRNDMKPQESSDEINRVDNVIQFTTPTEGTLAAFPNPLSVSRAKITLCHNAKIETVNPLLRTKISLKSIILTVAGKSQYLDPSGADVLGINLPPIQDILNAGVFDTTYVDDEIRISRGPAVSGFLDEQLRVFIRSNHIKNESEQTETESEPRMDQSGKSVSNVAFLIQDENDAEDDEKEIPKDDAAPDLSKDTLAASNDD